MKVSVITCTWNSEPYLQQSIESVLSQDYQDIEYIFVDGGSTDGTLARIHALKRPYKLLENVRGGISRAMNAGAAIATGDVIAHLHGDDYYLRPDTISKVIKVFESTAANWVTGKILTLADGKFISHPPRNRRITFNDIIGGHCFIPHQSTFVKSALFRNVGGFDESLRYAMDWDMWHKIARLYPPAVLEEDIAVFRQHSGSTSTGNRKSQLAARREERAVKMRYARYAPLEAFRWLILNMIRTTRLQLNISK